MFMLNVHSQCVFALIHVDDALIVVVPNMVVQTKKLLGARLAIEDMGSGKYSLGFVIVRMSSTLWIGQTKYSKEIISYFDFDYCNPIASQVVANSHLSRGHGEPLASNVSYGELLGALLCFTTNTCPDLAYAVGVLSLFVASPCAASTVSVNRRWAVG